MNGKAESETPRYDALYHNPLNSNDLRAWKKLAYDLERQHSLAQTEIKGHMRVAKEVRVDALEEAASACEALGRTPRNGIYMASARACADAIRELKSRA